MSAQSSGLAGLAFFSLIYGGLLAWRQTDLKAMIAYSSVSHMGIVLLGITTLNIAGLTGALMQMVAHGLIAGSLFLLIGLLYERTHTRDVNDYSSLVQVTPRFAFFTSLALLAGMAIPGTAGFIAELHAIVGGFEAWGWTILLISVGMMATAFDVIRWYSRHNRAEFLVRYYVYNRHLPEYLVTLAQRLLNCSTLCGTDVSQWQHLAHMIWTWRQSPASDRPIG